MTCWLAGWREEDRSRLEARFRRARDEGDLPATSDPELLARYVMTVGNGIAVQAAGGAGPDELHRVADVALRARPPAWRAQRNTSSTVTTRGAA